MKLLLTSGGVTNTSIREALVITPEVGEDFIQWRPPTGDTSTLGAVDFSICPHLARDGLPGNSMAEAEQWATGISGPAYATDDQTAIRVADGTVDVISDAAATSIRHRARRPLLQQGERSGIASQRRDRCAPCLGWF